MPRWVVGEFLTGKITGDVEASKGTWATQLNAAGGVQTDVPLANLRRHHADGTTTTKQDLRSLSAPWRSYIAAIDEETQRVHQAGPVIGRPLDVDKHKVTLVGVGVWAYWYRRVLRPVLLDGQRLPDVSTDYPPEAGLSKGTIIKRLIEQAMTIPGGAIPLDLPPDEALSFPGTERHYPGLDAALLGDRIKQMTEVENGPDVMFEPYMSDPTHIRWNTRIGTTADPYVHSSGRQRFDYSAPETGLSSLQTNEDSARMTAMDFEMGGGQTDEVLAGMAYNAYLLDHGYPLLESVTNRSTVSQLSTLDTYAAERVLLGQTPVDAWTLQFNPHERPFLSSYNTGDFCELAIEGDYWIPDSLEGFPYECRIVGLKGDETDQKVGVTFQEVTGV